MVVANARDDGPFLGSSWVFFSMFPPLTTARLGLRVPWREIAHDRRPLQTIPGKKRRVNRYENSTETDETTMVKMTKKQTKPKTKTVTERVHQMRFAVAGRSVLSRARYTTHWMLLSSATRDDAVTYAAVWMHAALQATRRIRLGRNKKKNPPAVEGGGAVRARGPAVVLVVVGDGSGWGEGVLFSGLGHRCRRAEWRSTFSVFLFFFVFRVFL